jgi:uncharacterized protein (TIGR03437 family)
VDRTSHAASIEHTGVAMVIELRTLGTREWKRPLQCAAVPMGGRAIGKTPARPRGAFAKQRPEPARATGARCRLTWLQTCLLILCSVRLSSAAETDRTLTVRISAEDTPPGASAQIKIFLASPRQVASGAIGIDFDPTVFGEIGNIAVFSATGDAMGYADVRGQHMDAHFWSRSGGIGQLPTLPILVVSIAVMPQVTAGTASSLKIDPKGTPQLFVSSGPPWKDTAGNVYSVVVRPFTFHVNEGMSILSTAPGGGLLSQGDTLQIEGAGFDSSTTVGIDGVNIAPPQAVSSGQILMKLRGPTEMTGKRVRVKKETGPELTFYSSLLSKASVFDGHFSLLLPLNTYRRVEWHYLAEHSSLGYYFALQNPTSTPATATFFSMLGPGGKLIKNTIVIPPWALRADVLDGYTSGNGRAYMVTSAPLRMLEYYTVFRTIALPIEESVGPPLVFNSSLPSDVLSATAPLPWNWQIGAPAPAPKTIAISSYGRVDLTVTVSAPDRQWLSVTPTKATAPASLTLTPAVSSLARGVYTAIVTLTPDLLADVPADPPLAMSFPVTITVNAPGSTTLAAPSVIIETAPPVPIMANIVNAASGAPGDLAPGEIISIFGLNLGGNPVSSQVDPSGKLPIMLGGTQVFINGQPAPLLYASASQVNAIVPYEVGAGGAATIQVVSGGLSSESWGIPVAPAEPALFTLESGVGQAAMLNQDNSYNSPANPAPIGSTVQLFATGGGQTAPASITGTLAGQSPDSTLSPVTVTIDGIDAPVTYHGSAPGLVAGLLQINAIVPPGVKAGPEASIFITIGGRQSPAGVTMAVQ